MEASSLEQQYRITTNKKMVSYIGGKVYRGGLYMVITGASIQTQVTDLQIPSFVLFFLWLMYAGCAGTWITVVFF